MRTSEDKCEMVHRYVDDMYDIGEQLSISPADLEIILHSIIATLEKEKSIDKTFQQRKVAISKMSKEEKILLLQLYENMHILEELTQDLSDVVFQLSYLRSNILNDSLNTKGLSLNAIDKQMHTLNKAIESIEALKKEILNSNRQIKDIHIRKPTGVVRCKDCMWSRLRAGYTNRYVCEWWKNSTGKNEFCSRAMKKD